MVKHFGEHTFSEPSYKPGSLHTTSSGIEPEMGVNSGEGRPAAPAEEGWSGPPLRENWLFLSSGFGGRLLLRAGCCSCRTFEFLKVAAVLLATRFSGWTAVLLLEGVFSFASSPRRTSATKCLGVKTASPFPRFQLTSQHLVGGHVGVRDDELDAADLAVELDGVLEVVLVLVAYSPELRVFREHLRWIKRS